MPILVRASGWRIRLLRSALLLVPCLVPCVGAAAPSAVAPLDRATRGPRAAARPAVDRAPTAPARPLVEDTSATAGTVRATWGAGDRFHTEVHVVDVNGRVRLDLARRLSVVLGRALDAYLQPEGGTTLLRVRALVEASVLPHTWVLRLVADHRDAGESSWARLGDSGTLHITVPISTDAVSPFGRARPPRVPPLVVVESRLQLRLEAALAAVLDDPGTSPKLDPPVAPGSAGSSAVAPAPPGGGTP